jgi:mannose-1-phosphate guanylyltransferase
MHADHHIRDTMSFTESIELAAEASIQQQKITLLGLMPTRAETGFGYIQRGEHANGGQVYDAVSFKEKPDKETAQKYLKSGNHLWNMGYFVAPLEVFEQSIKSHAPDVWENYQQLLAVKDEEAYIKLYHSFEDEPIDTALIEHVPDLLVVTGAFDWMDIGSYKDLHDASEQDESGNVVHGSAQVKKLSNSYVRNETDIPVGVIGLDNVAVVVTDDGILVTNKSYSQDVGVIAKKVQSTDDNN